MLLTMLLVKEKGNAPRLFAYDASFTADQSHCADHSRIIGISYVILRPVSTVSLPSNLHLLLVQPQYLAQQCSQSNMQWEHTHRGSLYTSPLFVFRSPHNIPSVSTSDQKVVLEIDFSGTLWVCPFLLHSISWHSKYICANRATPKSRSFPPTEISKPFTCTPECAVRPYTFFLFCF